MTPREVAANMRKKAWSPAARAKRKATMEARRKSGAPTKRKVRLGKSPLGDAIIYLQLAVAKMLPVEAEKHLARLQDALAYITTELLTDPAATARVLGFLDGHEKATA